MADARRYALSAQLDIGQILLEAQHRWLRPAEICEILQNSKKFQINPDPPNRPSSGSLFLFDRKVLRYFRKDGHNWRKKRDGKTVKEAHERLKSGSVDVLHCYYAHGENNENFQRRVYWMLEEELSHIVLVHYRQVEGNGINYNRIRDAVPNVLRVEDDVPNSDMISSSASVGNQYGYHLTKITDTSAQTSEYEDAESAYTHQSRSGFHTFLEVQPPVLQKVEARLPIPNHVASSSNYQGQFSAASDLDFTSITLGDKDQNTIRAGLTYNSGVNPEFPTWGNALGNWNSGVQPVSFKPLPVSSQASTIGVMHQVANDMLGQVLTDTASQKQDPVTPDGMHQWQTSEGHTLPMDQKLRLQSFNNLTAEISEVNNLGQQNPSDMVNSSVQNNLPAQFIDTGRGVSKNSVMNSNLSIEGKTGYSTLKQPLLDGVLKEGLQKLDSFDRWMSKELGDVNEPHIQTSSGANWDTVRNEDGMSESNIASQVHLDTFTLSPSLSQDQLFSILDFSPNWAYSDSEEKVLITGRFLKSQTELGKYEWAFMFGELEVPAEVIGEGVIRCHTPKHEGGRVPFYVTCSNRLACSEVREFEFRVRTAKDGDIANFDTGSIDECRHLIRFGKLLTAGSNNLQNLGPNYGVDIYNLSSKIDMYLKEEDSNQWEHLLNLASDKLSKEKVKDSLMRRLLKNQLHLWLLCKHAEGGKGPNVLDDCGQGVLHLAAALGYDWAIGPTIAGGVSVDFRDLNGWTALHWAAFYGRERTVASLISLGASPGALTDPTPRFPDGIAPADLASSNGHKGIAGYLAESTLSSHLVLLKLKDNKNSFPGESTGEHVQTASERTATPIGDGDLAHGVSLKDSLAALRNATQAAARIHQVFRLQSFQKKQMKEYGDSELSISDGRALSRLSGKTKRAVIHDEPVHAAATRIQNKFRSWKGRREYLQTRQRIIKIQAHVRGHQVRKNYKKITWSVGVLEKIILRWRRKGSGLRGYKLEAPSEGTSMQERSSTADEYDFFKEGRKQTEERLQKALTRVKSMVQYPEARDQYRRLLNVVSEMQSSKGRFDKVLNDSDETADFDEDLIDLDALLYDDPLMST